MNIGVLLLRADAGAQMGTGHLMRCLALGKTWMLEGGKAVLITACQNDALLDRARRAGLTVVAVSAPCPAGEDLHLTVEWVHRHPGAWLVLDGYGFDSAYQRVVKQAGARLLVVDDDVHADHYYADVILNQNIHATELHYQCEPGTQLLMGTRFALLAPDFLAWRDHRLEVPAVAHRVLVTLGGGDPKNQTTKIVRALKLARLPGLEVAVVVGGANPHLNSLEQELKNLGRAFRLVHNSDNMPELMAWAEMAVSAAGTTVWELAYMRVPTLVLVLAENQIRISAALQEAGLARSLGWFADVDENVVGRAFIDLAHNPSLRAAMSRRGRKLVDGRGADRVVNALTYRN